MLHDGVRVSQSHLAMVAEQATVNIVITDLRGMVLHVNPAYERMAGAWRGRHTNRGKDGTDFIAGSTVFPVSDPEGRGTHFDPFALECFDDVFEEFEETRVRYAR